ncbi:MAG: bifunctional biotin--[acetyl-CoA-carboxylase] ligase/biotin operon repressor BirA [Pseudomonadales bacterium]
MNLESQNILLNILADGEFHSGQAIGEVMGVSRAAIWKQLQKLDELGLDIESAKGRGYRIDGGLELLDESAIRSGLNPQAASLLSSLQIHHTITSTNEVLLREASSRSSGSVCLAEQQTAGRGRRGRLWVSPFARNIYLSMLQQFSTGAAAVQGLSLAVGVLIIEALEELGMSDLGLKWPNDIYWQDRKLAGILLELSGDVSSACSVVVGIGLNVAMPKAAATEIDQPWVDLRTVMQATVSRNELVAALLGRLLPGLSTFEKQGLAAYQSRWRQWDVLDGETVIIHIGDSTVAGVARGIDDTGAIMIETSEGERSFSGGEVSIRRAQDA